jgi:hypothetical protein
MPFTVTHTLAALPVASLWSRHGTFSALVIGTMVPDWPLYVPVSPAYEVTHSFSGLFTSCLPIGFVLAVFYHLALKEALFELLPRALKARVLRYVDGPSVMRVATLLGIAVAVLIGAATHLVWDAFTHRGAWGVELIPQLYEAFIRIGHFNMPGYRLLQHGFTLLGFPVFLAAFYIWYRKAELRTVPSARLSPLSRWAWLAIFILTPASLMLATAVQMYSAGSPGIAIYLLIQGVTRTGFAILVLLSCYALFFALVNRDGKPVPVHS